MFDESRSESAHAASNESAPVEGGAGSGSFPKITTMQFGRHSQLQITLDNETVKRLREPNQHAHVRDEQGNIVGVFKAMPLEEAEFYQYALETVDFDDLERRADPSRPGHTFEQVLERLRQLEREESGCASP